MRLIVIGYRTALIVQIYLQQNRTDLALKEVQAARKWAQDSLLVNIAESWVGLRIVCINSWIWSFKRKENSSLLP